MGNLLSNQGKVKSSDNIGIFYTKDLLEDMKGIVVIVHGLAEYLDRYDYVKDRLNSFGYGVYRFDNRGHGRSDGERGYIEDYNFFLDDADTIVELAKKENPDIPIFMMGHSMGGFIASAYGIRYKNKLNGQILSAAATTEAPQVKGIKKSIFKFFNIFLSRMIVKNELSKLISKDPEVIRNYEEDPMVLKGVTMKFYVEFLIKGIGWLNENMKDYSYPCFIIHGEDDRIVSKEASKNFYKNISSKDKEIKIYEGLYHEIMNEKEKDIVIEDIHKWLDERIN